MFLSVPGFVLVRMYLLHLLITTVVNSKLHFVIKMLRYLFHLFISFEDRIGALGKSGNERSFTHDTDLVLGPVVITGYFQEKRHGNSDATDSP